MQERVILQPLCSHKEKTAFGFSLDRSFIITKTASLQNYSLSGSESLYYCSIRGMFYAQWNAPRDNIRPCVNTLIDQFCMNPLWQPSIISSCVTCIPIVVFFEDLVGKSFTKGVVPCKSREMRPWHRPLHIMEYLGPYCGPLERRCVLVKSLIKGVVPCIFKKHAPPMAVLHYWSCVSLPPWQEMHPCDNPSVKKTWPCFCTVVLFEIGCVLVTNPVQQDLISNCWCVQCACGSP